jgi:hypothetical protein
MSTKRMTATEVNSALRRKGLTQWDLGDAAGLPQGTLSAILLGRRKAGPVVQGRISAAIVELGLNTVPPNPNEPVFEIVMPEPAESGE